MSVNNVTPKVAAVSSGTGITVPVPTVLAAVGPSITEELHVGTVSVWEIHFPDGTCKETTTRPPNTFGLIVTQKMMVGVNLPRIITTYTRTTPIIEAVLAMGGYKLVPTSQPDDFLLCRGTETVDQVDVMQNELMALRLSEKAEEVQLDA